MCARVCRSLLVSAHYMRDDTASAINNINDRRREVTWWWVNASKDTLMLSDKLILFTYLLRWMASPLLTSMPSVERDFGKMFGRMLRRRNRSMGNNKCARGCWNIPIFIHMVSHQGVSKSIESNQVMNIVSNITLPELHPKSVHMHSDGLIVAQQLRMRTLTV